ncbi:hypothetical protein HDV57DRAFT_402033 [Trichoderma longibrachiatum]
MMNTGTFLLRVGCHCLFLRPIGWLSLSFDPIFPCVFGTRFFLLLAFVFFFFEVIIPRPFCVLTRLRCRRKAVLFLALLDYTRTTWKL